MERSMEWREIDDDTPKERDDYSWSPTFLAWMAGYSDPFPCKQRGGIFYDLEMVDRDGDWAEVIPPPTHWQPLPPPPVERIPASEHAKGPRDG